MEVPDLQRTNYPNTFCVYGQIISEMHLFFRDENEDGNKDDSNRVKGKTVQTVPVPLPGAGGLDSEGKLGFKHIHNMFQVNSSFINQCVFGLN